VNCVDAVTVVPFTVVAVVRPTVAPSIDPPVITTALAFCVDIVPKPDTAALEIAIAVFVTAETCPDELVVMTGTDEADP
jgi:hypothetical protein